MDIAALDGVMLVALLLSLALGAWRGLVYEVLAVLGWIASYVVAQMYAAAVGQWLPITGLSEPLRYAAGFAITFIATAFVAGFLSWVAKKLIESVGLRPVDRTLGALFGVVRGIVILLAIATVVQLTPFKDNVWWQESKGAGVLGAMLKGLKPVLPNALSQYISFNAIPQGLPGTNVCAAS